MKKNLFDRCEMGNAATDIYLGSAILLLLFCFWMCVCASERVCLCVCVWVCVLGQFLFGYSGIYLCLPQYRSLFLWQCVWASTDRIGQYIQYIDTFSCVSARLIHGVFFKQTLNWMGYKEAATPKLPLNTIYYSECAESFANLRFHYIYPAISKQNQI